MPGQSMEKSEDLWGELKERVVAYLDRLEKPEGGFSFAPTAPPCTKDTLHATLSFRLLGVEGRPTESTVRWVANRSFPKELPLSTFAARITLYVEFGLPLPVRVMGEMLSREAVKPLIPRRLFHLLRISENGNWPKEKVLLSEAASHINPLPQPQDTLETLYYKAEITGISAKDWRRAVGQWLHQCRNGDGGYGCRPGTTSFLEHIYWAMRLLDKTGLGLPPNELKSTLAFVEGCQSRRGGFGRAPEGVPFIESTYHALWILDFLLKAGF